MLKIVLVISTALTLAACATQENRIGEYIKKNPKVVFDTIEANPDQFMDALNKAVKVSRESQNKKRAAEALLAQQEQMKNPLKPELDGSDLVFGSDKAPIVIVEYADFQCPACKMAHSTISKIKEKYKGQVQFHYKNMPLEFHPLAMPAARYYEAVKLIDHTKSEKFYNMIFNNQNLLSETYLKTVIKQVGLDLKAVTKKLNSEQVDKNIAADISEFKKFGFTGTPVMIVNGVAVPGAQPIEEVDKVIQMTAAKN